MHRKSAATYWEDAKLAVKTKSLVFQESQLAWKPMSTKNKTSTQNIHTVQSHRYPASTPVASFAMFDFFLLLKDADIKPRGTQKHTQGADKNKNQCIVSVPSQSECPWIPQMLLP